MQFNFAKLGQLKNGSQIPEKWYGMDGLQPFSSQEKPKQTDNSNTDVKTKSHFSKIHERNKHARQPRPENYEVPNCPSSFPFLKQFDKLMVQIYRIEPATKVGGTKQNQEYQILEE